MQIEPLKNFVRLICLSAILVSCHTQETLPHAFSYRDLWMDTTVIPRDTVLSASLTYTSFGTILRDGQPFSGCVMVPYDNGRAHILSSVYNGRQHGIYRSYYENGALHEVRQYKENMSTGRHYGFWPNGKRQFDYIYYNDKRVAYLKKWYETGKPYLSLNYNDDHESGLQQGWRENGKLFINYIAKDGYRYGLQETMLCYKLDKGTIIK